MCNVHLIPCDLYWLTWKSFIPCYSRHACARLYAAQGPLRGFRLVPRCVIRSADPASLLRRGQLCGIAAWPLCFFTSTLPGTLHYPSHDISRDDASDLMSQPELPDSIRRLHHSSDALRLIAQVRHQDQTASPC
jgi:hypothetical protein